VSDFEGWQFWQLKKDGMCSPSDEVVDGDGVEMEKCAASRVGKCGLDFGCGGVGGGGGGGAAAAVLRLRL
jgi:hypothetical protein